jgi:hypothetical protein
MVPMALLAARLAREKGYWLVFLLALAALPVQIRAKDLQAFTPREAFAWRSGFRP